MVIGNVQELLQYRKELAMKVCGIFDEDEIGEIDPISYIEQTNEHFFVTVWMFGNKKIYSAMVELIPGDWDDPSEPHGSKFFDVYKFKNIDGIQVDDFGCVITLRGGKKIELKSNSLEGHGSFLFSAHGLVRLWDEYDD
ncbi:hypothetical protein [Bifidobacterium crudilactis]|jgi:hypothetical protein|uniref:hypothetical protein n=1 Tax=Bifidobacterium crudilactis TaxID=327277 RepID=UPI0023543713|nr:hypothetical protein [Bifidobacterium crudilactis]MCI2147973.1 hypothetical protein [Bifidobacterium crudilactis]MCI2158403.1 hypothetical protein [Bifidobacterium crudilactis]